MKRMKVAVGCFALICAVMLTSGTYAATVCVSRQTDSAVTLAFAGLDGLDYELFLAHGATDGGDDKSAWDNFQKVADVAYDQTSLEYEVPAALRDGRLLRFFLMQSSGIACVKEYRSMRSTGTQFINLGVNPAAGWTVDLRFGKPTYQNNTAIFGGGWAGSKYLLCQQNDGDSQCLRFYGGGGTVYTGVKADADYRVTTTPNDRLVLSDGTTETSTGISRTCNSVNNFCIFASKPTGANKATYTFYRMRIASANATLAYDLVPAANADGIVGLYDQLNNVFYKDPNGNSFVAGDEVPAGRFGRVVDVTPTFKFSRTVAVASATSDAVTLAFGNPTSETLKLYVASGTSDAGADKNAWTSFDEVADIAGDQAEYTYTLPAALKAEGMVYRFFLVKSGALPYAAELASVSCSGAQAVHLDYAPGTDTTVDIRFGNVTYAHQKTVFGQFWGGSAYLFNYQSSTFRFHGGGVTMDAVAANTDYRFQIESDNSLYLYHGDTISRYSESRVSSPIFNLTIFSIFDRQFAGTFRFDSMKVKDGAALAYDLVPVETADGAAALFNRVTGRLYENATTTALTKGAAVARQVWPVAVSEVAGPAAPFPSYVKLTEDTDWTGSMDRIAAGTTIDLNGFELHLAPGASFSQTPISIVGDSGTLRLTVPAGETYVFDGGDGTAFSAAAQIVKDGDGILALRRPVTTATGVTVEKGIVRTMANALLKSGTPVTVRDGGAYDMYGYNSVVHLDIAGTGPDGAGALRNTRADLGVGVAQMTGLSLSADATVGGSFSLGIINNSYAAATLELNGHTFTLNLPSGKSFWISNTSGSTAGRVFVASGQFYPYRKSYNVNLPNVDLVADGANAQLGIFSNSGEYFPNKMSVRSVTVKNGATLQDYTNRLYMQDLTVLDGGLVPYTGISWLYVADTVLVSNETTDVTIYAPICNNNTYPRLIKQGAGTLTIANNYTDQRIDRGLDLQGGKVVMSSSRTASPMEHRAISSQAVPFTLAAGTTLDMSHCTNGIISVQSFDAAESATLLSHDKTILQLQAAMTFTRPQPFTLPAGTLRIAATLTFDLADYFAGASAPAAGSEVTLLSAPAIDGSGLVQVTGCPHDYEIALTPTNVVLLTKTAAQAALAPIKVWTVGGSYAAYNGSSQSWRLDLAAALAREGWNVEMTGMRHDNIRHANGVYSGNTAWAGYSGFLNHALKTSATRAGILEGLETFCAAANEPDFTIFVCGDADVADGVADDAVFVHYTNAVTRIKAALPMTTVLASTIVGASDTLNAQIAAWCADEADVESVDLAAVFADGYATAQCTAAADALKAKLLTLATANGKNTPSGWTRPAVTLGAENNVPAEYRAGYTRVRSIEPSPTLGYAQSLYGIPYAYAPSMQEQNISKVAYYIELVRKDTGALQALWIDMDAPGTTWADVALPVTHAQRKQQTVTKLHVWSNFGGVTQVPASDDTVEGYIEFNPINYTGNDRTGDDVLSEPWAGTYGANDTLNTSGASGHACFQFFRKFSDASAFPAWETLFAYNRWGSTSANVRAIGMGTLADYGNLGVNTSKTLDWTFAYDAQASGTIDASAYSFIRIDFWVQYSAAATRAERAGYEWTGSASTVFNAVANWEKDSTAATSLANQTVLLPEGTTADFTYVGYDPISLSTTTLLLDGTASYLDVGGFYLQTLDMGATGRITYDPTKFTFRLVNPPTFASGAKIALTPNYAANTKGRFLLMTWNNGSLDMAAADLNALFDAASANGADVKVWAENLETGGGRLWLDLDYSTARQKVNVLCIGDSITQGSDSTYGNWRTGLMKKLAAAGYEPVAKGFWTIQSHDICGAEMPDDWIHHAGISGQRLITNNGAGTADSIEATLDQAGDVDFVLVKLGTNDINGNNRTAEALFPVWSNFVWRVLDQKPHAKFIAGAVVDIAYTESKNLQVTNFNAMVSNAIANAAFPAKRAYFADLYTPCYRYDENGTYITGSFYASNNLHPDWPGEDKMAETYLAAIQTAIADDPGFELNAADTSVPTTGGAESNVPAEYLAGYTRARVLDLVSVGSTNLSTLGYVPYSTVNAAAPTGSLSRVGYYIELRRRNDAQSDFHGLTRWMWVSMDAFGGRTLDDVGVPLTTVNQCAVKNLRVKTNVPGIESTAADDRTATGWIEFWPSSYDKYASGLGDAPTKILDYFNWNDSRADNMTGYGTMQVHRITPNGRNPAQTLFAFNRWTSSSVHWEIGLGTFANQATGSIDWTFTGASDKSMFDTMALPAYEVARIEIWTAGGDGAVVQTGAASPVDGGVAVDGTLEDLGPGAESVTVTLEWSHDPEFGTVAGSQAVGTFTETGDVSAMVSGLDLGDAWYFRFRSVTDNGNTTTSEPTAPTGFWRPQTASDVWTSVAWLKDNAGSPVAFNGSWTAFLDGQETVKPAAVEVPEDVSAAQVVVAGSGDYTLTGAGGITSGGLVKSGSGTLTLDAAVLAGTRDIEVREGTVKLSDDAVKGAAGADGGTITVKNGARFDVNYYETTGGTGRPRALVTGKKKFVIEGTGPDGQGALFNTRANETSNSALNEVELTGDATIGGSGRIDLSGNTNNTLTGPTNATLTVAVATPSSENYGFCMYGPASVGKVVVLDGAKASVISTSSYIHFPYGIDLYGRFWFYNCGALVCRDMGPINAYGANAQIGCNNGTAYVKAPVNVASGATLTMNGSATTVYSNGVSNAGTISMTSGTHHVYGGELVNTGNPVVKKSTGNRCNLYPRTVSGDSRLEVSAGQFWISGITDWGDNALAATISGSGALVIGDNANGYGVPQFAPGKFTVAASGSAVGFYHPSVSTSIYGPKATGTFSIFHFQGPTTGAVIDMKATNAVISANEFRIGVSSGRGEHTLSGAETDLSAGTLYFAQGAANNFRTYYGNMTVKGGRLAVGTGGIEASWRQPMRPFLNMENGTLQAAGNFGLGKYGLVLNFGSPVKGGAVDFDLNGKTVRWSTGLVGGSDVTLKGAGTFTTQRPGVQGIPLGKWTVESTGSIDLRNAAGFAGGLSLAENATATLDIAGSNMVDMVFWNWHDNAWDIMRPLYTNNYVKTPHVATSLTFVNRTASTITESRNPGTSNSAKNKSYGLNYIGEFHVGEEQAGTWYFNHRFKQHFGLFVDDTELTKPGPNNEATASVELEAGWHRFMISSYSGDANPSVGPYSGADALKFKVGEDGTYQVFDSTTVPMRRCQDDASRTTVRFRKYLAYGSSTAEFLLPYEHKFTSYDVVTNSIRLLHTFAQTGVNGPLGAAVVRFDGYFKVEKGQAGQWLFTGQYDDRIVLDVDGRRLVSSTGASSAASGRITLSEGWHRFEVRAGDNTASGNTTAGSGAKLTDALGNVCAIRFSVNGGATRSFDERYVPISYAANDAQKFEEPGLGGEIELAAGSTLVNAPREGGWCPIYGTLKGTGTLSGPFRFTGDDNCWEVTGTRTLSGVAFANADADALAGLKNLKVTFDRNPKRRLYDLSDALGLTAETVAGVALSVADEDGNDYSENFTLTVKEGRLVLTNGKPAGMYIILR